MGERERQAVQDYQNWLLSRFPHEIEHIVLFGSKARGDAGPMADIDLLIVLRGNARSVSVGFYALGAILRMNLAEEKLQVARELAEAGHLNDAINRAYYLDQMLKTAGTNQP